LKQVSASYVFKNSKFLLFILPIAIGSIVMFIYGCSTEKPTGFNRSMQNLTAHYNILFDANQILQQKQDDYALGFIDSYSELLNVYQDTVAKTTTPDKDLQAVIDKAYKIINFKDQSHYIGDAYLVMGKANYLRASYFDASEYFSYVVRTYPKRTDLVQEALIWKARTLLYLDQPQLAKLVLDTVLLNINPKKAKALDAGAYAAKLQYDINVQDYTDGEEMAKQAISFCNDKKLRLRWTFILAQLQELNNKNDDAIINYGHIAKSNADFEMAFNAQLNRIRIEDMRNGINVSPIQRLQYLLKNPNNKEFKDQIYYQVGQILLVNKDIDNAIKNYKLSIRNSVKNQNQKGLSYLRIADINFNIKADYVTAKKYYDSTLTTLSPNYPGYQQIQKKTNNLQLLTDRLQIIAREDTLQMLAKLDDKTRQARIDAMVTNEILQQQNAANNAAAALNNTTSNAPGTVFGGSGTSNFYFYNSTAVSQGYNDFKKAWGNRKLEDNWRRSNRSTSDQTNSSVNPSHNVNGTSSLGDPFAKSATSVTAANYRQQLVQNLPLTPDLLAQSNLRIYNAYFDIANFYRDILDDKKEAIATFEKILARFPNNPNQPAIYYSLYRLYSELNDPKADMYKNLLLKNYPETAFAKVILDPDFGKKLGDKDAEFNAFYSQAYDLYAHKKYSEVIKQVDTVLKQYPASNYAAQLYYLRAIAAGHQEPLAPFQKDLQQIATNYPNDRLITPLVQQHLNYINANLVDMSARHYALMNSDTSEVPFSPPMIDQEKTPYLRPGYHPYFATVADVRKPEPKVDTVKKDSVKKVVDPLLMVKKPVNKPSVPSTLFSMRDSTNYYFVINISNDNTNLASSRFGIGQFNRANFQNMSIKHLMMDVGDNNRLIYVGKFNSLEAVKVYARAIIPIMPEIMKVEKDKYSFFIITKGNLDKLADKKTLDSYIDYYQNNY